MWFEWKIAWRFLISGKLQTLLILLGIVVGVSVQVFLGSLIGGLQKDLINQTVGDSSHITITAKEQTPRDLLERSKVFQRQISGSDQEQNLYKWKEIEKFLVQEKEVTVVSPTISSSGFGIKGAKNMPLVIRGVDLAKADNIYDINNRIKEGLPYVGGNVVLIGKDFGEELKLFTGDTFIIRNPQGIEERFVVGGIFDLGSGNLNKTWVIMSLQRASIFFDLADQVTSLEIQIQDVFKSSELAEKWSQRIKDVEIESWQKVNGQLLTALQSQESSSIVIQVFIMIAVTLGIASVLAISVVQKGKQIGILKAMGVKPRRVGRIFLIQGALLGAIGSIIGVFLGTAMGRIFVTLVRTDSGEPLFPIEADFRFMLISGIVATLAGMMAALIPARNSAKLSPIEVIRNG